MSSRRWVMVGAALLLSTVATNAAANGRFPRAQRFLEHPLQSGNWVLSATYGLLVTNDGGGSWHHVCEAVYGERELTVDALTAFSASGVLLAGIYSGVSRTTAHACDFERTLGRGNHEAVPDFALAAASPGRVLAILSAVPDPDAKQRRLYRSDDDGLNWRPWGVPLPASLYTPLTIEVAPSDSDRVYLSGLGRDNEGVLLRSDDGGLTFQELVLPVASTGFEYPYIAGVDPKHPERLYVRTDAWRYDAATDTAVADDALLYSPDGGSNFSELFRAPAKLFGFAFSPAGDELLLGYGDPREPGVARRVDAAVLGIYRAPAGSPDFQKRYAGSVHCLNWSERGVFVCTDEVETGFSLGVNEPADFELTDSAPLAPLLRLADVAGPIACDACSPGAVCQSSWFGICQSWGRADCRELQEPSCPTVADGGAAGAEAAAGAGGHAVAALASHGGCRCAASPVSSGGPWAGLLLLLAVARRRFTLVRAGSGARVAPRPAPAVARGSSDAPCRACPTRVEARLF